MQYTFVQLYTGLPNAAMLQAVYEFTQRVIQAFQLQEMMMTLANLRLNLSIQDLAYSFQVSHSAACVILINFMKWLIITDIKLKH